MQEEKEIKIEIIDEFDINKVKNTLENNFDVKFNEMPITTYDTYFDFNDNKFFLLNHSFRLRKTSDKNYVTYKALFNIFSRKENPWFILEEDYEIPINRDDFTNLLKILCIEHNNIDIPKIIDENSFHNILKQLGMKEKIKINKKRYIANAKNHILYLDLVEDLGIFLEIEFLKSNFSLEILKNVPFEKKRIYFGYTNLYANRVLGIKIPDFKRKYINNPEWNFIGKQKEIVKKLIENE